MRFVKAHAYGNDFLYVEQSAVAGVPLDALARELCDRHTGVGADGLIVFSPTTGSPGATGGPGGSTMTMTLFNADGSRAEVSGNGVRGLGALLFLHEVRIDAELTIETDAGPKRLTRTGRTNSRQTFCGAMGLPKDVRRLLLPVRDESVQVVALNFGNPQCVVLGKLPSDERFRFLGAALERHETFHDGTNVEFAEVETPQRIRIRIWERGVGPTQSSGTGSCAALVAAATFGYGARAAEVIAPGGSQRVEWREDNVYLTGWAEVLCEGEWLRPLPS
jgi:diaminopimelate epimerase